MDLPAPCDMTSAEWESMGLWIKAVKKGVLMPDDNRPYRYFSERELYEIIHDREASRKQQEEKRDFFVEDNTKISNYNHDWVYEAPEYTGCQYVIRNMEDQISEVRRELAHRRADRAEGDD